jgi:two-component system, chemotaxis family, chemotaxis protein CheY
MAMFPIDTNILVVDDMLTMRKLVIKSLKELGFTKFVEASNGAEAYEKLKQGEAIQLIISDWNMPQTSGLDLLKRVRAEAKTAQLPFLMVTAEAEKGQIVEAVQAGVSNYMVKPFNTETLKEKLEAVATKLGL